MMVFRTLTTEKFKPRLDLIDTPHSWDYGAPYGKEVQELHLIIAGAGVPFSEVQKDKNITRTFKVAWFDEIQAKVEIVRCALYLGLTRLGNWVNWGVLQVQW